MNTKHINYKMKNAIINKKIYMILVLFLLTSNMNIQAQKTDQNFTQIINTFSKAITNPEMETEFYNLFLHDSITWATVNEGKTKEDLKSKNDYQPYSSASFKTFYKMIKTGSYEEKFYNIITQQDDNYATISFDYSFHKDTEIKNWGKEYWTLLKVDEQWKITSVLWTTNYQYIEKCPFK
ncbi:MAG: hypothetical protein V3U92_00985 [Cellulophaga sp.]